MTMKQKETLGVENASPANLSHEDAEHFAWAEAKIRSSIKADDAHPDRRKSLEDVKRDHGVR